MLFCNKNWDPYLVKQNVGGSNEWCLYTNGTTFPSYLRKPISRKLLISRLAWVVLFLAHHWASQFFWITNTKTILFCAKTIHDYAVVAGEALNFAAYAYAPAILVTPLGALSIIFRYVLIVPFEQGLFIQVLTVKYLVQFGTSSFYIERETA